MYTFLSSVLEDKEKKRKNCQVLKSLLFAEHLQVNTIALCGLTDKTAVAQSVERLTAPREVVGSIPGAGPILRVLRP